MTKLLLSFALITFLVSIKAQTYVTIPDANFVTWLQTNIPSAMNGNQMDITSTAVTTRTNINVYCQPIGNLDGVQYFSSLNLLNCGCNNYLTQLPSLPSSIEYLYCGGANITSFNSLPPNLIEFSCGGPNLNYLPITFPSTLKKLSVIGTTLTTLPALPSNLEVLDFSGCLCSSPAQAVPTLPNSLKTLSIAFLKTTTLPAFPASLQEFYCDKMGLVQIPSLPNNLKTLVCSWTQITSIPTLPDSLETLNCIMSQSLISIPILPKSLKHFDCAGCPLVTCIPALPNSLQSISLSNSITCLPNYVAAMPPSYFNYPICEPNNTTTNPNNCPKALGISGNTYFDANNSCHDEITDIPLKNITLKLKDSTNTVTEFLSSGFNGSYNLWESAGTYTVSLDTTNKPYKGYCHINGIDTAVVLTTLQPNADSVNFSIKCKSGFDVGVQSVVTTGLVFPGQFHHLKINAGDMAKWYGLNCASGVTGQMIVDVTGALQYSFTPSGALLPTVSGNTFTYSITDFGTINNNTDFDLVFQTDTMATAGDSICVSISITTTLGDINPSNNNYHFCYNIVNSYDPNKKEVYPIDVLPNYQDWFTYTIHFQNTGNAPAINIRLKDTLDANLDIKTFEVINYSHTNTWQMYNNSLVFNFQNIQLPDSTTNPEGSKGFVQYRIKPKAGMPNGSQIKNTAYIYFDFNAPIITNTTFNHFMLPASLTENFINKLVTIYPNPTTGSFSIQLNSNEKHTLEVIDLTGKTVQQQIIENGNAFIDGNILSNGIYTIKVYNNSGAISKKLVILK